MAFALRAESVFVTEELKNKTILNDDLFIKKTNIIIVKVFNS